MSAVQRTSLEEFANTMEKLSGAVSTPRNIDHGYYDVPMVLTQIGPKPSKPNSL